MHLGVLSHRLTFDFTVYLLHGKDKVCMNEPHDESGHFHELDQALKLMLVKHKKP